MILNAQILFSHFFVNALLVRQVVRIGIRSEVLNRYLHK